MPATERQLELLRILGRHIARLEAQSDIDASAVEADGPLDAAVQRWLQISIQCCIDLGDSLLSLLGEPEPPRQRDVFPVLVRRGVISEATSQGLIELAVYRNTHVHAYESLSPALTWAKMKSELPVLKEFASFAGRLFAGSQSHENP